MKLAYLLSIIMITISSYASDGRVISVAATQQQVAELQLQAQLGQPVLLNNFVTQLFTPCQADQKQQTYPAINHYFENKDVTIQHKIATITYILNFVDNHIPQPTEIPQTEQKPFLYSHFPRILDLCEEYRKAGVQEGKDLSAQRIKKDDRNQYMSNTYIKPLLWCCIGYGLKCAWQARDHLKNFFSISLAAFALSKWRSWHGTST